MFPPIKIVKADHHEAHNGPVGVWITTGTRYFAAVLLQEIYEARRFMAWFWLPTLAFAIAAAVTGIYWIGAAVPVWMLAVGKSLLPTKGMLGQRELMGQAIEIAVIEMLYKRENMNMEYLLQARSMVREDSSYAKKGLWPDIPKIPVSVNFDSGHPSIMTMARRLHAAQPKARAYVLDHIEQLRKWRPMGAESKGY